MPALATQIIDAIQSTLQTAYPDLTIYQRKGKPGADPASPTAGWTPGMKAPCFVVSMDAAEEVDEYGSFETVTIGYPGQVSYVKPAAQMPGQWEEDPDIRTIQEEVRQLLYLPWLTGLGVMANVSLTIAPPYTAFAGTVKFYPLLTFVYTGEEPRPDV